jgi:hypothetical protein
MPVAANTTNDARITTAEGTAASALMQHRRTNADGSIDRRGSSPASRLAHQATRQNAAANTAVRTTGRIVGEPTAK